MTTKRSSSRRAGTTAWVRCLYLFPFCHPSHSSLLSVLCVFSASSAPLWWPEPGDVHEAEGRAAPCSSGGNGEQAHPAVWSCGMLDVQPHYAYRGGCEEENCAHLQLCLFQWQEVEEGQGGRRDGDVEPLSALTEQTVRERSCVVGECPLGSRSVCGFLFFHSPLSSATP